MGKNKETASPKTKAKKQSVLSMIIVLMFVALVIISVLIAEIAIRQFSSLNTKTNENYLLDTTVAYGNYLDFACSNNCNILKDYEKIGGMVSEAGIDGCDSSYAYITNLEGLMMYHPTADKVGTQVENPAVSGLVKQIASGSIPGPKVINYNYKGSDKLAAYYVSKKNNFILVISVDVDQFEAGIVSVERQVIILSVIITLVLTVICSLLLKRQIAPITKVCDSVDKLAKLDLTEDKELIKISANKFEAGNIAKSVEGLRTVLAEMVSSIRSDASRLYDTSETLNGFVVETTSNVDGVEVAVNEIANGATNQASETQKATEDIIVMGNMIEDTNTQVSNLNDTAVMMKESNQIAIDTLKELDSVTQKAIESIDVIYEQTNTTNASAMKIKEATSLIASIAEETNLLSLNASIEAARAGEAGRGFAVVASQIQKLAAQSNESAEKIDDIIKELVSDSEMAVHTMEDVKEIMQQQNANVQKTSEVFEQVRVGILDSISGVDIISGKTSELDGARNSIVDTVQSLSAIAEENAASTQETSASMIEIGEIVKNISSGSESVKDIAAIIEQDLSKFIV